MTAAQRSATAFEKRWRNAPVEHGAIYRPDGSLLVEVVGTKDSLEFPLHALSQAQGATATHNHTRKTGPSLQDVVCGIQWELLEVRVASGDHTYTINRLDGIAVIALRAQYGNEFPRQVDAVGDDIKHSLVYAPEFETEVIHRTWGRVSKALGFGYRRVP